MQPLAKLVRLIVVMGPALAGENDTGCGYAGETGESDQLPAHSHRLRRLLAGE